MYYSYISNIFSSLPRITSKSAYLNRVLHYSTDMKKFWTSKNSSNYTSFASTVPSDIPVNTVWYNLLSLSGKIILDFGCFRGKSSMDILKLGARKVIGVDVNEENIQVAKSNYVDEDKLVFFHVPTGKPIPTKEEFDGAAMVFVHPSIDSYEELEDAISKISNVLKNKAKLMIIGIHPNALEKQGNFLFFRPSPPGKLEDGIVFHNTLMLSNKKCINLLDSYWSNNLLRNVLEKNKFSVEFLDIPSGLENDEKELFKVSLSSVEKQYSINKWLDEWDSPLYQIILAEKQ